MKRLSLKKAVAGITATVALAVSGVALTAVPAVADTPCYNVGSACVRSTTVSYHATSAGSSSYILVFSNQAVFTATSSASWLSASPSSAKGSALVGTRINWVVQSNTSGYNRSAYILLRAGNAPEQRVYFYQGGPLGEPPPPPVVIPPNTLNVNPASLSVSAGGSKNNVDVTTNAPGGWTATSSDSWISVTPSSGASGESFVVTYQANPSATARIGTVVITAGTAAPYNFILTQAGAAVQPPNPPVVTPVLELDYDSVTVGRAAKTVRLGVTTNATTAIAATSSAPAWLTPVAHVAGSDQVRFTVTANTTGQARWGYITYTVNGVTAELEVTQSA
jgi:hypothetical protein